MALCICSPCPRGPSRWRKILRFSCARPGQPGRRLHRPAPPTGCASLPGNARGRPRPWRPVGLHADRAPVQWRGRRLRHTGGSGDSGDHRTGLRGGADRHGGQRRTGGRRPSVAHGLLRRAGAGGHREGGRGAERVTDRGGPSPPDGRRRRHSGAEGEELRQGAQAAAARPGRCSGGRTADHGAGPPGAFRDGGEDAHAPPRGGPHGGADHPPKVLDREAAARRAKEHE